LVVRAESAVQNRLMKVWKSAGAVAQPLTIHADPVFSDVPKEDSERLRYARLMRGGAFARAPS
jgi:hypothetical protein